jgi:hypothetical protein
MHAIYSKLWLAIALKIIDLGFLFVNELPLASNKEIVSTIMHIIQ